jgi:acetyl esterase/lipase
MTSLHLVRPELRPFLASAPTPGLTSENLTRARLAMRPSPAPADDVDVETAELRIPGVGPQPDVRALVYRPLGVTGPRPGVLHLHGGG